MAVSGEHRSLDSSLPHELTSKTPFLYVLIGILTLCVVLLALLIRLCVRLTRTSEKREMLEKETNLRASSGPSYEVFLSFRGADSRYRFTNFLYRDLVEAGILVFKDNESLHVGKRIGDELLQAIENSKIYIPIFSKNYASSHWCLQELAYMVECTSKSNENKEILPIFLDVEPDDIKLQTNLYNKALSKHQKKFCIEFESWKKALTDVGDIKGWNWNKDESQGDLILSVVRTVSIKLKVAYENVTEHLVGVEDRIEAIIKMLDGGHNSVRFLGIHGMGGVGKTTLAKVIFNTLSSSFDRSCFLADIRESSKGNNGLVNLQKQMLSKLLGSHSIDQIYHVNDGINMINRGVLRNKKVLIVLDDVDEKEQLKSLAEKGNWFGSGSRIIITTRDQSVLMIQGEATYEGPVKKSTNVLTYDVQEMEFGHALKLFSRHAFRRDSPPDHRVSLSEEIVHTLGKLPLALEIKGSSLNGKSEALWIDTLKKLKQAPPMEVQRKLMITYERLDHEQRQVFLDIACFFVSVDKTYPLYMWDDCGYHPHDALEVLFLMSLIKIKKDNTFWMHDQVRDLGREIVRQENFKDPNERSRVWNRKEALSILEQKEGSRKIEALSLGYRKDILTHEEFANLQNLRFFEGDGVYLVGDFNNLLSRLRWLSWGHCPSKFEATNFRPTNLVVLDLSWSYISEEWTGWNQIREANKLKVLDLSKCRYLKRTPDLSTWVSLERLILEGCDRLTEIDPSIGKLKLLITLNLKGCYYLRELPEEIGCLQALTEIVMPHTAEDFMKKEFVYSKIDKLPYSIGGLVKLTRLNLSECAKIKELPDSVGKLQSLVELDLSLTSIGHLPNSIGNLKQLKVLRMRNIRGITKLPSTIGLLEKLEELDASACHNLTGEIPKEIGRLSCLKILDLSDTSIFRLPDSIGDLKQLKVLRMSRISGITRLPSTTGPVEKPKELDASSCHDLISEAPEEIERQSRLRILDLSWTKISGLPTTVSCLSNLQTLKLELCPELKQVYEQETNSALPTSIGALSQQETLDTALPTGIGTLSQMETLTLSSENVQFFPQLPCSLRELQLKNLATPRSPDFSNLRNLSTLTLYGCSMPEFSGIVNAELELVRMDFCKFRKLDALFQLEMKRLRSLTMCRCEFLPEALDLSRMKNLQFVFLSDCQLLGEIRGLEELVSLSSLQVERCGSMERMSDLSKLKKLRSLRVENCPKLRSVEGLNHLESLESLMITNAGEFGGDTSNLNVKYTCIR